MNKSELNNPVLEGIQKSPKDTGSTGVQVALLSDRIKDLTEHLKSNRHDYMARRGLLQLVGQRRRLLRYMAERNSQGYLALIQKLGLRR